MSFKWIATGLEHTALDGTVTDVPFENVPAYLAALPQSEKQTPIPPYDPTIAETVVQDSEIQEMAASKPDALVNTINDALARSRAALDAAQAAYDDVVAIADGMAAMSESASPETSAPAAPAAQTPPNVINPNPPAPDPSGTQSAASGMAAQLT